MPGKNPKVEKEKGTILRAECSQSQKRVAL